MLAGLTCSLLVARLLAELSLTLAVFTGLLALLGTAVLGGNGDSPVPGLQPRPARRRGDRGRPAEALDHRPGRPDRGRRPALRIL